MVARYAELDGIGRYAEQMIGALGNGRAFVRIGVIDGPGDYHRAFDRGPRALWLLRDARRPDDIVVHYHPHYYGGGTPTQVSWGILSLLRRVTFVIHELDTARRGVAAVAQRWGWRRVPRVVFTSDWQRDEHVARFGRGRGQELLVMSLRDFYSTSVELTREDARRHLGLPTDRAILLMIGFISASMPDKGYDRAIDAFRRAAAEGAELHIVGSPIRDDAEVHALLDRLRQAAAEIPGIVLHEGFVDHDGFDLWLRAADWVLTPYRQSSSSGVIARAHLLGARVITSDVGGLPAQAGPGDIVVRDDAELLAAIRAAVQRSSSSR
jgi:glycosyltransferase involved in cell wall biosynthesis